MVERALNFASTSHLKIAYLEGGIASGPPCLLVHGWPDDALTWDRVAMQLEAQGVRTIRPYLRGFGPTQFHDSEVMRSGQLTALALDMIEFIEALDLRDFVLVGHDWGARISYMIAARLGNRIKGMLCLSVGYGTNDPAQSLSFEQARMYWYHWYFATERGRLALRADPQAFTRQLWRTWSPSLVLDEQEWHATARSFDNPDWVDITIDSYRHRWGLSEGNPRLAADEAFFASCPLITVPTVVMHGSEDGATLPAMSEHKERFFTGGYTHRTLPGVGHFMQREKADHIAAAVVSLLKL